MSFFELQKLKNFRSPLVKHSTLFYQPKAGNELNYRGFWEKERENRDCEEPCGSEPLFDQELVTIKINAQQEAAAS
jgi:hypothetical protein